MATCEKCWGDAYRREMDNPSKCQAEHYHDLIEERKNNPCSIAEQIFGRNGHLLRIDNVVHLMVDLNNGFKRVVHLMVDLNNGFKRFEIENKGLKEQIIQLKTQVLGGSENDSCFIEGCRLDTSDNKVYRHRGQRPS